MSTEHDFDLRPFQEKVFNQILNREKKRVILQAPTGAGKTRAALAPFIHRLGYQFDPRFSSREFPLTCRYAVPTRTLASQFYREHHTLAARIDDVMPTRIVENYKFMQRNAITIQTGEQSNDPQMEGALTFCTIDQLLASAIAIPYGLGSNLANINVGGVAGSYLVLDEFHLYPLVRGGRSIFGALTTVIKLLSMLKDTTPFVLMTATFSTTLLKQLAELLDAREIIVNDPDELKDIADGRIRTFRRSLQEMSAKSILNQHKNCSMAICNTVARAQKLWLDLQEEVERGKRDIDVVLLHSRFTDKRRYEIAQDVEEALGPALEDMTCGWKGGQYYGRNIIFVATQVVEVGLNISVEMLHTEIAPASNIIQRAGRCARFEKQRGEVIVYQLPSDPGQKDKKASALPYDSELCDATWSALEQIDGKEVGFKEEQKLIDDVHEAGDSVMLEHYKGSHKQIFKMIVESFKAYNPGVTSELIRDVAQVQVLIYDDPKDPTNGITETPWLWQSFGIHPGSLAKWWKAINDTNVPDVEWVCKKIEIYEEDSQEPDNRPRTKCTWVDITNPSQILAATLVVVPRRLASYNDKIGFMLLDGQSVGGNYQSVKREVGHGQIAYKKSVQQNYQDHIFGLLAAYESHIQHEMGYIALHLEQAMHLPEGIIDHTMRLAIACHDLGKLGKQWQQWARSWQTYVMKMLEKTYQLPAKGFLFAKTEYDYSARQKEWQHLMLLKRPHHACESVKLGRELIGDSLGITKSEGKEKLPVLRAACTAIARHHTSQAREYSKIELAEGASSVVDEVLRQVSVHKTWSYDVSRLKARIDKDGDLSASVYHLLTEPDGEEEDWNNILETLLYFVVVRALRLADQRAGLFHLNS